MKRLRHVLCLTALVSAMVTSTGCAYYDAIQRLTPAEQTEFRVHNKVMTSRQVRAYLAKATAAERTAYLGEIGIPQRFQALEPQDREAILAGSIRQGMSAEGLRYLWGDPYYTQGYPDHYEYWYYLGTTLDLTEYGHQQSDISTIVEVYLVDGRLEWWLETVPTDIEGGTDDGVFRVR